MRISRKQKKPELTKIAFYNGGITAPKVLTLGAAGENLGILVTAEAIRQAREQELDLVLINPKSDPPVAKIMDFGQFRYQQEKEERIRRAHQHVVDTKGLRLSLRIGAHDLEIRKNRAVEFLKDGDKVKIEIMMRGRELQQIPLAFEILKKFVATVNEILPVKFDEQPERQGNKVAGTIARI